MRTVAAEAEERGASADPPRAAAHRKVRVLANAHVTPPLPQKHAPAEDMGVETPLRPPAIGGADLLKVRLRELGEAAGRRGDREDERGEREL